MPSKKTSHTSSGSSGLYPVSDDVPFGRPKHSIPDIPDDITIASDEMLMEIFSRYVQWQNYSATQLAGADIEEERATRMVKRLEAEHMVLNWSQSKGVVTLSKALMATSDEINKAREEELAAYAHRKLTQVIYENCERTAAMISRELTRRLGREPYERRAGRWNP